MKIIISPAKKLTIKDNNINTTIPLFIENANKIAAKIEKKSHKTIKSAFNCSDSIADDVSLMYKSFNKKTNPALYFYDGLQYKNINLEKLKEDEINFLLSSLYIADSLYGLLRASDEISSYRLDFKTKFPFVNSKYYKGEIAKILTEPFLNLCSKEYSAILPKDNMITINFIQNLKGSEKSYSTYTKMARGKFVNYLARQKDTSRKTLISFSEDGYKIVDNLCDEKDITYLKVIN